MYLTNMIVSLYVISLMLYLAADGFCGSSVGYVTVTQFVCKLLQCVHNLLVDKYIIYFCSSVVFCVLGCVILSVQTTVDKRFLTNR